jgi:hypothetical protein
MNASKRYFLIACAVLGRECYYCASMSPNIIDIKLLDKGLHDIGEAKMRAKLQAELDSIKYEKYDAILLAYGLCNNGIKGLHAPIPVVVPRAHDCITLFMGSKEKYERYFYHNPGVYFETTGWLERGTSSLTNEQSTLSQIGIASYQEYVEKYGEEDAKYIMETLGGGLAHYEKLAYIDMCIGNFQKYKDQVKRDADEKGWKYEELKGDYNLIRRLIDGEWNEDDFLIIPPDSAIEPSYDNWIIKSVKIHAKKS